MIFTMTSRERILASLQGLPTDRIAVSPFIHNNFVRYFFADPELDDDQMVLRTMDVYEHFGFDAIHRNIEIRFAFEDFDSPDWKVLRTAEHEQNTSIETVQIKTPERTLTQVTRFDQITEFLRVKSITEHFIKEREDFRQFAAYMPPLPHNSRLEQIPYVRELIGERGIIAPWTFGLFNFTAEMRKLDNLLVDMLLDEDFYHEMMEFFFGLLASFYAQVPGSLQGPGADNAPGNGQETGSKAGIDAVSYPGNLANGITVGSRFFNAFVLPYEKRMVDAIQKNRTAVIYHNCGNARNLVDSYNAIQMRCFETMTEPPHGDMDLAYACQRFDPGIALMGNLDQINLLTKGTPDDVRKAVRSILKVAGSRPGFILSTSDFLEEGTPERNLEVIMETVLEG